MKTNDPKIFKALLNIIFFLIKVGPITELKNVPGNEPSEKHAQSIPATLFSKKEKINNLQIKLLEIIEKEEAKAMVVKFSFIIFKIFTWNKFFKLILNKEITNKIIE